MTIQEFPPVDTADEHGLLAIGGDTEAESLLLAYKSGIFPWPLDGETLAWFCPPQRAVLFLEEFRISKNLKRDLKKKNFTFSINQKFKEVLQNCASSEFRKPGTGTWISEDVIEGYLEFHKAGYAHSIEVYEHGELVGGQYGVSIGNMWAGESMFYKVSNASKASLCFLVEYLLERGVQWIDCQVLNPFTESFGAKEVSREEFLKLLKKEVEKPISLF